MNILYHHRTRGRDVEKVHILGVVNGLKKLDHKVFMLSPPGVSIDEVEKNKKADMPWSKIARKLPEFVFELMEIFYNFIAYYKIIKIYKKNKIDGIYERYFLFSFATVLFAQRNKIPLILELNDASFIDRVRKLKMKRLAAFIEKYTFNKADALIAVSSQFKNMLMSRGISAEKIFVIHNAVNPEAFSKDISGLTIREKYGVKDKIIVGFIGSMVPWHGLHSLIECARDLGKNQDNLFFMLVGDFKNLSRESLQLARSLNDHIILTGKVLHDNIPDYIAAMDIAIMPNSNSYGSPMKIFEYMAMGKAVIAPDLGPLREIIKHGENGLLIKPGDMEDIKEKISYLASNRQIREKLGQNALEYVLNNHTWDINSKKIAEIFNWTIGQWDNRTMGI